MDNKFKERFAKAMGNKESDSKEIAELVEELAQVSKETIDRTLKTLDSTKDLPPYIRKIQIGISRAVLLKDVKSVRDSVETLLAVYGGEDTEIVSAWESLNSIMKDIITKLV